MKKISLIIFILIAALLLSSCGKNNNVDNNANLPANESESQQMQKSPLDVDNTNVENETPSMPDIPANIPENYDPSSEEDTHVENQNSSSASVSSNRAGATAVVIDPVDLPTATPRPPLTFSYSKYVASNIGISFESVAGYSVDESQAGLYVLTEPVELAKDNVQVQIILQVNSVDSNYKLANLKRDLQEKVKQIGSVNYETWKPTGVSSRTLLGKSGFYQDFRGVAYDGTIVRGRVHVALIDGNVLTLQYICPGWYNSDYTKVYSHIRDTMKIAR